MPTPEFRIGQTVYIQGYYKAKVREIFPDGHVGCDVYEGLNSHDKVPSRYTYAPFLLEEKRRK